MLTTGSVDNVQMEMDVLVWLGGPSPTPQSWRAYPRITHEPRIIVVEARQDDTIERNTLRSGLDHMDDMQIL